ncbi:hypothetical protein UPYG_G00222580 [Umbra pygmaea]|uniref:Integrase zinc-binding domain-containing protein n=1 Tax=Umbra pygmaea TaxID=75934 RepID=A0ABD0WW70_UMBPY
MPRKWGWELCSLNGGVWGKSYTPVLSIPGSCPRRKGTMMWGIGNCSPSSWHWRSGDIGWMVRKTSRQIPFPDSSTNLYSKPSDPAPSDTPAGKTYVPAVVRPQLLTWSHIFLGSGHPGITKTVQLLGKKYWWASLQEDVTDYVLSCKTPKQFPADSLAYPKI